MDNIWVQILGPVLIVIVVSSFANFVGGPPTVEECLQSYPNWSQRTCELIAEGTIKQGMTKEQVVAARGRPNEVNETITEYGSREQWVYSTPGDNWKYLYFEDNKLTGWQT